MVGQKRGNEKNHVICCFCGKESEMTETVQVVIYPNQDDESQNLFAYKDSINTVLHPSVPRHPDLLSDV